MTSVITVRMGQDNFSYLHPCGDNRAFVVDPGEPVAVRRSLGEHGLSLAAILLTHHHWDHVGGAAELRSENHCEVIGVDRSLIPASDHTVTGSEVLNLGQVQVEVIPTPGHTRTSASYYVRPQADREPGTAYTGDTLFVGGCGRLLEGDAATMWQSLQRLAALPPQTLVYCGHDYTLENYEFAVAMAPESHRFRDRLAQVQKALEYGQLTVPSTIAQERATNIFLQAGDPQIKAALGMPDAQPHEVLAELRRRKDLFG